MPFTDAGARADPLVVGVDELGEVLVGEVLRRDGHPDARDLRASGCERRIGDEGRAARAGRGESRRAGGHRRLDRVTRAGVGAARVRPDRHRGHRERRHHPRSINSTPTGVFPFSSVYPLSPHARSTRA